MPRRYEEEEFDSAYDGRAVDGVEDEFDLLEAEEQELRARLARGESAGRGVREASLADEMIDQLIPASLDWKRMVREHPWPAVGIAALGGYVLGRTRGPAVLSALMAFAATTVADGVNEALGEDVL